MTRVLLLILGILIVMVLLGLRTDCVKADYGMSCDCFGIQTDRKCIGFKIRVIKN